MVVFSQLSQRGERDINEDCVGFVQIGPDIVLLILADGLGGHGRGEDASVFITEKSAEVFRNYYKDDDCLARCFEISQEGLLKKQEQEGAQNDLKSTLVLLYINQTRVRWGHIGDSRLYYFMNGHLKEQTADHSVPQMLVASGEIELKDIRHHPDRNRLVRVMGTEWETPRYQLAGWREEKPGQAFLLCSDGFWENIEESQMEACLKHSEAPGDWLEKMEKIVLKNGKGTNMDNYSAIAAFVL